MKKNRHGADLYALETKYHYRPEDIRDFSSNINPLGPSPKALEAAAKNIRALCRYPDPEYRKLKAAIGDYLKVDQAAVLLGSGTSQLIQEAIAYLKPARALINSPCYSEYARELEKIGAEIFEYHLDYHKNFSIDVDEIIARINEEAVDLYVLTNPNNPTGSILTRADVARILDETSAHVLVDETYIEFTDPAIYSAVSLVKSREKLIVIRGTSKFFATPGIRLGYAVTGDEALHAALAADLSMWGDQRHGRCHGAGHVSGCGFSRGKLSPDSAGEGQSHRRFGGQGRPEGVSLLRKFRLGKDQGQKSQGGGTSRSSSREKNGDPGLFEF